jgi:hypothetical protein
MAKNEDTYEPLYPESHTGINININLAEFPKCPHCENGIMLPLSQTDHRSVHVFNYGWICNSCYKGWMWNKGTLVPTKLIEPDTSDDPM